MMIDAWAEKLAFTFKNINPEETASVPVMKFALTILLNYSISTFVSLTIGLLSGQFLNTVIAAASFMLIRIISGGFHFRSAELCLLTTISVISISPHIHHTENSMIALNMICFLIFSLFSPSNIKGYTRIPEKYFPALKILSLLMIGVNFMFFSPTVTTILTIQAILLLIPMKEEVK